MSVRPLPHEMIQFDVPPVPIPQRLHDPLRMHIVESPAVLFMRIRPRKRPLEIAVIDRRQIPPKLVHIDCGPDIIEPLGHHHNVHALDPADCRFIALLYFAGVFEISPNVTIHRITAKHPKIIIVKVHSAGHLLFGQ